jgi:solute carrier family 25, member 33/36
MAQDHRAAQAKSMMSDRAPLDSRNAARLADDVPLVESRELGDVVPSTRQAAVALPFAKSWVHFVAGGSVPIYPGRRAKPGS